MSTVYMYSYPEDKYKWWCESTCHNEVQKFSGLGERLADSKKRLKARESLRKGVAKQIFWLSNQVGLRNHICWKYIWDAQNTISTKQDRQSKNRRSIMSSPVLFNISDEI